MSSALSETALGELAEVSIKEVGFPNIARRYSRGQMSSDFEIVHRVRSEFERAWNADQESFAQLMNNWRMYFGWPGEQWSLEALKYKAAHKQRAAQYNIIKPKVNIFQGSIIADEYDFKYTPIDRRRTTAIKGLEDAYYCDKEECNYDYHYSLAVLDGCIHVGVLECVVTTQYDQRGNIAFIRRNPAHITFDPYWTTDDDSECMSCWKHANLTARQIVGRWKNLPESPKLREELARLKKMGMSWQERNMDDSMSPFPMIENTYQVIEAHWIEEIHCKRIIGRSSDGRWIPFPVTEDNELLEVYAAKYGVNDWQDGAEIVPYTDRIHWQAVICPELFPNKAIEYGKPEVQIQRLPFLQFTCYRDLAGRNQGIVGALTDPQLDINYSRSKILDILATQQGGALIYDKNRLSQDTDQLDFERNHNDSTRAFALNGPTHGFSEHLLSAQVSGEVIRDAGQSTFDMADRVTNVPAAMQAETQSADEPASLFAMKLRQAKVGTRSIDDRVKNLRVNMALAYFLQARISYAGAERVFTSKDGTKEAAFNVPLDNGMILNRIDMIPRCTVSIEEAPGNMTRMLRDRMEIAAVLKALPPTYQEHIAILLDKLLKTANVSAQTREDIEEATELQRINARLGIIAEIATKLANQKNAELAILNLQNQIDQIAAMMAQKRRLEPGGPEELPLAISEPEPPPPVDVGMGKQEPSAAAARSPNPEAMNSTAQQQPGPEKTGVPPRINPRNATSYSGATG